jgi:hypothetical protein
MAKKRKSQKKIKERLNQIAKPRSKVFRFAADKEKPLFPKIGLVQKEVR